MANILVLKSSILGQYSQSNALIDGYLAERQGDSVTVRDLATLNLPVLDGELAMGSGSLKKSAADHNGNRLFCQGRGAW